MKKSTWVLAIAAAALLVGCGGGGSSSSTTTNNGGAGASSSSTATGGGNSGQLQDLLSQVDARSDLSGKTVKISDPKNISILFKEHYFLFYPDKKVKFVINTDDDDQYVYDATYTLKTDAAFGNQIVVNYTESDGTPANTIIELDDDYHVKEKQLNTFPAQVYTNENNGLVIQEHEPATGANALTVTTPDNVKGYTISSNEAVVGNSGLHTTIVTTFNCDGSFNETQTISYSGHTSVKTATGTDVSVRSDTLVWNGTDNDGESSANSIDLDSNHQIIAGKSCYMAGSGSGEDCPNNLYVKTITKDTTCQ